jgi:type VI secretion system secreted protein VgrG
MQVVAQLSMQDLPDDVRVLSMTAREALSEPFEISVRFVCADPALPVKDWLWTEAALQLQDAEGSGSRIFHGIVEAGSYQGKVEELHVYRVELRPRLHGLQTRVRSRIFQDRSVPEIVQQVLSEAGLPSASFDLGHLSRGYRKRELLTQWKESELAFVSRLLEDEGILYSFTHADDGHVLVAGDGPDAFSPIEGDAALPYRLSEDDPGGGEFVFGLTLHHVPTHDATTVREWDERFPSSVRQAAEKVKDTPSLEWVQQPAGFKEPADASRRAKDLLQSLRARRLRLAGDTNSLRLLPGRTFELSDAVPPGLCRGWTVRALDHAFTDDGVLAGTSGTSRYRARFELLPDDVPFRPARLTPRPVITGKESAVVVGPKGEEIHVDAQGRVKVHFYWDREGKIDDTASCWIRTQQQNTSGAMVLPRIGWEVEVGFLHGDPDRPIVLQKLYNKETMPPYELPGSLTHSALQSSSSPGGGGTNEIRMNDGSGGMEFFVHAQRDFSMTAGNDFEEEITVDSSEQVGSDAIVHVDKSETIEIGGNLSENVTGGFHQETAGARNVQVGALQSWGVGAMHTVTTGGDSKEDVSGLQNVLAAKVTESFNGDLSRSVGAALCFASAGPMVEAVSGSKTETIGGAKVELIRKARAESVGTGKILTTAVMQLKTGKGLSVTGGEVMATTVGGPWSVKCDKDFALSGQTVMVVAGQASFEAGSKLSLTPASAKLEGDSLGGSGSNVKIQGKINYRSG